MRFFRYLIISMFLLYILGATSLFSVFQDSGPAEGYDKYLTLNADQIYTGGLGIFENSVYIEGNGSVIDLENGGGIWVYADPGTPASLDIFRCTVINGADYGLNYSGVSTGSILNCNIINSGMGIQMLDTAMVTIKNCNLINNDVYGMAVYSTYPTPVISWCNAWGNGEDYMENCPG